VRVDRDGAAFDFFDGYVEIGHAVVLSI
jgi:hypothetical protein